MRSSRRSWSCSVAASPSHPAMFSLSRSLARTRMGPSALVRSHLQREPRQIFRYREGREGERFCLVYVVEQLPYKLATVKDQATDRIADRAQEPVGVVCKALDVPLGIPGRKEARTKKTPSESLVRVVPDVFFASRTRSASSRKRASEAARSPLGTNARSCRSRTSGPLRRLVQVEVNDRQTTEELPEQLLGRFARSVASQIREVLHEVAHLLAGHGPWRCARRDLRR